MSRIVIEISMSLDGFVAGPNDGPKNPIGDGGEQLHDWMFGRKTARDAEIAEAVLKTPGAFIIGRRMFENGEEPWGDESPFPAPVFVLSHRPRPPIRKGAGTFTFVAGLEAALAAATAAAAGKDVTIMGGGSVARQFIAAGLADELHLHLAPMLLGGGVRLFEADGTGFRNLERIGVEETPAATHLRFRLR